MTDCTPSVTNCPAFPSCSLYLASLVAFLAGCPMPMSYTALFSFPRHGPRFLPANQDMHVPIPRHHGISAPSGLRKLRLALVWCGGPPWG